MPVSADNIYDVVVEALIPLGIPVTADIAGPGISLPFVRYVELGEAFDFFTRSKADMLARTVIVHAEFQLSVFAGTRLQCRQISRAVMAILDDYTAQYNDGRLMYINPQSAIFIPEPSIGPNSPIAFHRAITFRYNEQRII